MRRAIILLLALLLDLTLGDPPNQFHPVALMGRWLQQGRRLAPARGRFWFGLGWVAAGMALCIGPGRRIEAARKYPILTDLLSALMLKSVFAYRNLRRNVNQVGQALAAGNLPEARRLTSWHLVSRDTRQLNEAEVAGAAIESLAENITDSVTAPLMAYALGGLPAAWAYRFANTADAMWGYRTPEFEQLGKFPARLDDALNWLPARLTGWLLALSAWPAGEDGSNAARTMLAQHQRTPSPNAGWTMSAMAGALGVMLTKRGVYRLEGGQAYLDSTTIQRAIRVADICVGISAGLLCLGLVMCPRQKVTNFQNNER
jgi:adenosylcobinamide-phosphate synthase